MGPFWVIAAAMVVAAGAIVLIPFWRNRAGQQTSRDETNTRIFRERLADLEAERREGRVDAREYQQLRQELERTLLVDVPVDSVNPSGHRGSTLAVVTPIALLAPLLALGYYYVSAYRGETQAWIDLQQRMGNAVEMALQRSETLLPEAREDPVGFTRALQSRLLAEGMNNPQGLFLLGVSFLNLQAANAATTALEKAYRLAPQRPDIALAYAQALMMTHQGRLTEESGRLITQVLRAQPDHQRALMLLGFGAFNMERYPEAIKAWRQLLVLREPDSDGARLLRNSIARAEALMAAQQQPPSNAADASASPATASAPQIKVTVDLAPDLQKQLTPEDTLFIFAKAAQGPPMPLAAVRQPARSFPVQVVLDDSQAMMPSMKLSSFKEVVVGARVSKRGDVMASSGDLEGISSMLSLTEGSQSVSVVIDQVIP